MAETIRDVVIKIALQQADSKLKVPDVSAYKAALGDIGKLVTEINASAKSMSSSVAAPDFSEYKSSLGDILSQINSINAGLQSMATASATVATTSADVVDGLNQIAPPIINAASEAETLFDKLDKVTDSAEEATNSLDEAGDSLSSSTVAEDIDEWEQSMEEWLEALDEAADAERQVGKAADELKKKQSQLSEEISKQTGVFVDNSVKSMEGARTIGDGLFTLQRGLTFFGVQGDKTLEQFVKGLAKVQGAFDVFRGGVDIIKGVVDTTKAVTAATTAYTAAQTASTTANALSATTAAQSATAKTAENDATVALTSATVQATGATAALNVAMLANPIMLVVAALTAAAGAALYYFSSVSSASEGTSELEQRAQRAAVAEKQLEAALNRSAEAAENRLDAISADNEVSDEVRRIDALSKELSIQQQLARIDEERKKNSGFRSRDVLERRTNIADTASKLSQQNAIEAQSELNALNERDLQLEKERLGLLQQQADAREDEVAKAKETLQTIQDQLAAERGKSEEMAIQLGRLTQGQRNQLQRLSDKAKSGQDLSNNELERLQRLGGPIVQDYVKEQYKERGQGFTDVLSPFTKQHDQKVKSLEQQESFMKEIAKELDEEAKTLREENKRDSKEAAEAIKEYLTAVREGQKELKEMIDRMRDEGPPQLF